MGAEGGAWGRDKLFLPWSPLRRGDRTGLEPQLSTADNIHMSVRACVVGWMCVCVEMERLGLGDEEHAGMHTLAQIDKYHS